MSRRRDKKPKAEPPLSVGHAIAANLSRQVPNNSWGPPKVVYVDIAFCCRDCGQEEVWTAEQQKWYYEVAKGTLYATAVRCRACRNRISDAKEEPAGADAKIARELTLVSDRFHRNMFHDSANHDSAYSQC